MSQSQPFFHTIPPDAASNLYDSHFAAVVPPIPDLSSFEQFKDVDDIEQLRRVINTQRLLIMALNVQPDSVEGIRAFELRYIWDTHRLTIAFLGKGAARTPQVARQLALDLWEDLNKLFPREYYRGGLLPATTAEAFQPLHQPFALDEAHVVTLSCQVQHHLLLCSQQPYAVPYPYRWGISSMAGLCKTLSRQDRPHMVCLTLVPWQLQPEELQALNTLAGTLRKAGEGRDKSRRMGTFSTLATGDRRVTSRDPFGQAQQESFLPDPQAALSADIYEALLERLEAPMIFRPYVVASGGVDPSVVGALQAEMVGHIPTPADPKEEAVLPHLPRERWLGASPAAYSDLLRLEVHALYRDDENPMTTVAGRLGEACAALARLPYLVDVLEASCAFRLPALPRRDEIGLSVHSGAFISLAQSEIARPFLTLGTRDDGIPHHVRLSDLTKHVLVVGTTGSGKTTTCLLAELAQHNIPFLVIDPVNAEHNDYRALLRLPAVAGKIQVFTMGDEETAPFRLNPFEIQRGVTVNEHISAMLTAFKAAIPMWEPLPRLFLKALNRSYYRLGWTAFRKASGQAADPSFPTMRDFYRELSQVVDHEIEHEGEVKGNIRGASKLRIEALLEGSCGRILSARHSLPIDSWMEQPTILELRHIGDDEDKALMIAFILLAINEYLDKGRPQKGRGLLQHVTLIEEAHRLLENVSDENSPERANTKGQAAQAFARALAESRKYGEGIIIAEQLPTKLVPDVIGNTGLKIMHRLTSADDQETMGKAMRFDEFQQDHVVTLRSGQAAVYDLDAEEPALVQCPNFWAAWESQGIGVESEPVSDSELATLMHPFKRQFAATYVPYPGCRLCPARCQVRDHGEGLTVDKSLRLAERFNGVLEEVRDSEGVEMTVRKLAHFSRRAIDQYASEKLEGEKRRAAEYCLFLHLKDGSGLFPPDANLLWEKNFRVAQETPPNPMTPD